MVSAKAQDFTEYANEVFSVLESSGWKRASSSSSIIRKARLSCEVELGDTPSLRSVSFTVYDKDSSNPEGVLGCAWISESDSPTDVANRIESIN